MENQIVIGSPDAKFHAYISRPAKLPELAQVALDVLFCADGGDFGYYLVMRCGRAVLVAIWRAFLAPVTPT